MKLKKKHVWFATVLAVLVIGLLEITLYLLAWVSPRVDHVLASPWPSKSTPHTLSDERLGHRPNPAYPGHDRHGFRNPRVPDRVDIVALGDSQTYGVGVSPRHAWPRQLEAMTGRSVYNMAYGGYGPVHRLMLWDEAMALEPNVVIEAFYAGNDLFESFDLVYNRGQLPELKSADPQRQAVVQEAEQSESIAERVSKMFRMGSQDAAVKPSATPAHPTRLSPRKWLSAYSKLYGLLRRTEYEAVRWFERLDSTSQVRWEKAKAFAEANPDYCQVFRSGPFRTIFTSEYRLSALDLDDPRIVEGLQISLRAIQQMQELATEREIRLLVVLIPTKETVFRDHWQQPAASYRRLTAQEAQFWTMTKDYLTRNSIEYLDALPALQKQLEAGVQPYQVSQDGHPNRYGHQAIAKLVAAHLNQL